MSDTLSDTLLLWQSDRSSERGQAWLEVTQRVKGGGRTRTPLVCSLPGSPRLAASALQCPTFSQVGIQGPHTEREAARTSVSMSVG